MGYSNAQPGQRTGISVSPRDVLASLNGVRFGRGVIDAAKAYDGANVGYETQLRPGLIMAMITATKLWVPCKRTQVNMTGATTTSLVVDDARAFKAGETITIGSDTGVAVSAIDYATNTLTIASTTVADNEVVFCDSIAGSEIARGILNEFVNLKDEDGTNRNKEFGQMVVSGMVKSAMMLSDYLSIRAASGMYLSGIQWDDQQGQAA